MTTVQFEMSVF